MPCSQEEYDELTNSEAIASGPVTQRSIWDVIGSMLNKYEIRGEVTAIIIEHADGTTKETLIDTEDLKKVRSVNRKWFISEQNGRDVVMAHTVGGKSSIYLSRVVLGVTDTAVNVDYVDHDTLNNRRSNLITLSKSGSGLNRKGANKNNKSSGVVGVSWNKGASKWMAQITYKRKNHYLGLHDTIEQAEREVKSARTRLMEQEEVDAND